MTGVTRYPINMDMSEREVVRETIFDRRSDISSVWTQLTNKTGSDLENTDAIYMSAYEQGFVVSCIAGQRERIPGVWKRLIDSILKFREDAGVVTTDLGNNTIQLIDNEGIKIVRQKYDWEM
jgi:hypothetical protein